jgi:membrane-associated protease RseP (regulator of RpoE activity)
MKFMRPLSTSAPAPARAFALALVCFALFAVAASPARAGRVHVYDGSAWIGVGVEDASAAIDGTAADGAKKGAVVVRVFPGSPAKKAGLEPGDVIVRADDEEIRGASDLMHYIPTLPADGDVKLEVRRGATSFTKIVHLDMRPKDVPGAATDPFGVGYGSGYGGGLRLGGGYGAGASRGDDGDDGDASDPFGGVDIDVLFPPGWDAGLDPAIAAELRRLLDEMRLVLKGASTAPAPWRADVKDPFSGAGDRARAGAAAGLGDPTGDDGDDLVDPFAPRDAARAHDRAPKPAAKAKPKPKPAAKPPAPRHARPGS